MTDIASAGGVSGASHIAGAAGLGSPSPSRRAESTRPTGALRQPDRAEISDDAALLSKLYALPQVREELVDSVRDALEQGTYETPEKLDAAIEELVKDLNDDLDALR